MKEFLNRSLSIPILAVFGVLCLTSCASQGENLFKTQGCINCHRFKGQGGNMGPDLTGVTSRRSDSWIAQQIHDSSKNDPASRMPAFPDINYFEMKSLLSYLRTGGG